MQYSLLNLLRFFAAFLVVFHHFAYSTPPFDKGILNNIVGNGHFAVTFFFVLSGFVMALSNDKVNFGDAKQKKGFGKRELFDYYQIIISLFYSFFQCGGLLERLSTGTK